MDSSEHFQQYKNSSDSENYFALNFLSAENGAPFPLALSYPLRALMALSLILNLIYGTKFRMTIISYIKSPETKVGPINYLIWVDQLNSIFLSLQVLARILFLILPQSFDLPFGEKFCFAINLSGSVYIAGAYAWGCFIAIFRVLFVKAQTFLKTSIGIRNVLQIMLTCGLALISIYSYYLPSVDDRGPTYNMCRHKINQMVTAQVLIITLIFRRNK